MGDFASLASAYEGVEDLSRFEDSAALAAYREQALEKAREQAEFIAARLPRAGRVVEIGCGNGRLPIALVGAGAAGGALGVDISRSRIAFAQAWAQDAGLDDRIEFTAVDALQRDLPAGAHDAAVCITGALAYFDAYVPGACAALLEKLRTTLAPGGPLVLELYPHPRERRLLEAADGEVRLWSELPGDDPWRFYLSDMRLDDGNVLVHEKTFVHRTSGEVDEGRSERLVLYRPHEIAALLDAAGFRDVECREGWSDEPYAGGAAMVVTANAAAPARV